MSFIQCPECDARVESSKAYCPDCGAAMDEEEKRVGVSEFDSLMRTQNISHTTQLRMVEQFKMSTVFNKPQSEELETNNKQNSDVSPISTSSEEEFTRMLPENPVENFDNKNNTASEKNVSEDSANKSKKNLYVIAGIVSFFLILAFIIAIISGVLIWIKSN